jgi:hypothetical protein
MQFILNELQTYLGPKNKKLVMEKVISNTMLAPNMLDSLVMTFFILHIKIL